MDNTTQKDTESQDQSRIFTALKIPKDIARQLLELPDGQLDARWNHSDDLHITLRFIGYVSDDKIDCIKADLDRIRQKSVSITINGLGSFPDLRKPVLYADVQTTRKLDHLVASITDLLLPYDIYIPEYNTGRRYNPHITLARLKRSQRGSLEPYIQKNTSKIQAHFQACAFHLLQSGTPDNDGAVYTTLASYPLNY